MDEFFASAYICKDQNLEGDARGRGGAGDGGLDLHLAQAQAGTLKAMASRLNFFISGLFVWAQSFQSFCYLRLVIACAKPRRRQRLAGPGCRV